jgi:EPS-associated MarR family transcriptional regulator
MPTTKALSLHDETHLKVLRLLETNPNINQRKLAESLGVSLGKTNFCLKALLDKGLVKIENFRTSTRKLNYAYLLTPKGIAEKATLTQRFLKRKMEEYEALKAEIELLKHEASGNSQLGSKPITENYK